MDAAGESPFAFVGAGGAVIEAPEVVESEQEPGAAQAQRKDELSPGAGQQHKADRRHCLSPQHGSEPMVPEARVVHEQVGDDYDHPHSRQHRTVPFGGYAQADRQVREQVYDDTHAERAAQVDGPADAREYARQGLL